MILCNEKEEGKKKTEKETRWFFESPKKKKETWSFMLPLIGGKGVFPNERYTWFKFKEERASYTYDHDCKEIRPSKKWNQHYTAWILIKVEPKRFLKNSNIHTIMDRISVSIATIIQLFPWYRNCLKCIFSASCSCYMFGETNFLYTGFAIIKQWWLGLRRKKKALKSA